MEMGGASLDPAVREGLAKSWKPLLVVGAIAIFARLPRDPRARGRLAREHRLLRLDPARRRAASWSPAPSRPTRSAPSSCACSGRWSRSCVGFCLIVEPQRRHRDPDPAARHLLPLHGGDADHRRLPRPRAARRRPRRPQRLLRARDRHPRPRRVPQLRRLGDRPPGRHRPDLRRLDPRSPSLSSAKTSPALPDTPQRRIPSVLTRSRAEHASLAASLTCSPQARELVDWPASAARAGGLG